MILWLNVCVLIEMHCSWKVCNVVGEVGEIKI